LEFRHRPARALLILAGSTALALFETGLWRDPATRLWGGPDPAQDVFILSWVSGHLVEGPAHVFDANTYHPSRDSILFCNPLLGPAALVLPLRALTGNPVLLYNAALVLGLAVASCGFYLLAFHLFADRGAALLAGIVVPYAAQVSAHLVHLDQMTIAGFPFVLLAILKILDRPTAGFTLLLALAFALQAGTNGYHAWSLLILCLAVAAWAGRRLLAPRVLAALAAAALLAVVLLAPYVLGFLRLRGEAPLERRLEDSVPYSVELPGGLLQTTSSVWRAVLGEATRGNRPVFPGAVVLVFAVVALRRWREANVRLLLLVAVVFFLLCLGPELRLFGRRLVPLPFVFLFEWVPLFDAMRHPVTFATPGLMALGLLAAGGLAATPLVRQPYALALVLLAATVETLHPPPARVTADLRLPEAYSWLETQPRGALFELPFDDHEWQWWSMLHGLPLVNGACGSFEPTRYAVLRRLVERRWTERTDGLEGSAGLLYLKAQFPARYLVLHPGNSGYYRENLEKTPGSFELLRVTASGDRIYRVGRGGRGRSLRRDFRDDALRGGPVRVRIRGPEGAGLRVLLGELLVEERPLRPEGEELTVAVPERGLRRGPNPLRLEQTGDPALPDMELLEIEATSIRPKPRSAGGRPGRPDRAAAAR
jgi:hypothetical protein